jgi:hypothetical protein
MQRSRLSTVSAGVRFYYAGLLLLILTVIGFLIYTFIALLALHYDLLEGLLNDPKKADHTLTRASSFVLAVRSVMVLCILWSLMLFVGKLLCLGGPAGRRGKGALALALALDLLVAGVTGGQFFIDFPKFAILIRDLLVLASLVLFIFFLRDLGKSLQAPEVVKSATGLLKLSAVFGIFLALALYLFATDQLALLPLRVSGWFPAVVVFVLCWLSLAFLFRPLQLLSVTKRALTRAVVREDSQKLLRELETPGR